MKRCSDVARARHSPVICVVSPVAADTSDTLWRARRQALTIAPSSLQLHWPFMPICHEHNLARPIPKQCQFGIRVKLRSHRPVQEPGRRRLDEGALVRDARGARPRAEGDERTLRLLPARRSAEPGVRKGRATMRRLRSGLRPRPASERSAQEQVERLVAAFVEAGREIHRAERRIDAEEQARRPCADRRSSRRRGPARCCRLRARRPRTPAGRARRRRRGRSCGSR